jgi:hypothetical protein
MSVMDRRFTVELEQGAAKRYLYGISDMVQSGILTRDAARMDVRNLLLSKTIARGCAQKVLAQLT